MKKILCAIFLLCLSFPAFAADKQKESSYERVMRTGTLRCGVLLWPPYFEQDLKTGALKGLFRDTADAVAEILDLKIEYHIVTMGQQTQDLESRKIDVVCNDGPYSFSSMKYVAYSKPLVYAPLYVYGRTGETRFSTLEQLDNTKVKFLGLDGDVSVEYARFNFPQAQIVTMPAITDAGAFVLNLAQGKADVAVLDQLLVDEFNKNNPDKQIQKLFDEPLVIAGVGFSVAKGEQELLNTLDIAVDTLWNMGLGNKILRRWDPNLQYLLPVSKPYEIQK